MKNVNAFIRKPILLFWFCAILAFPAWADGMFPAPLKQTSPFGFSPFAGYRFGGDVGAPGTVRKYSFDEAASFGLVLNYAPPDYPGRFELLWSRQESGLNFRGDNGLGQVDLTIDVFQLGGVSEFGSNRLRSYVSAHLGFTQFSPENFGNKTRLSLGIGAGMKAFLTQNLYLRADLRGYCTAVESRGSFFSSNGNTVATFSGSTLWQGEASLGVGFRF